MAKRKTQFEKRMNETLVSAENVKSVEGLSLYNKLQVLCEKHDIDILDMDKNIFNLFLEIYSAGATYGFGKNPVIMSKVIDRLKGFRD